MKNENTDRRSREDATYRNMENARWEKEQGYGPFWLWCAVGFLFAIAFVLA